MDPVMKFSHVVGTKQNSTQRNFIMLFKNLSFITLASLLVSSVSQAAPRDEIAMITNSPFQSTLIVSGQKISLQGRISLHLSASQEQLKAGVVQAHATNLVLGDAPQELLTGRKTRGKSRAILGIALAQGLQEQKHVLKYDDRKLILRGQVPVSIDFPQLDELFAPQRVGSDPKNADVFTTKTQKGLMQFEMKLEKSLVEVGRVDQGKVQGVMNAVLKADPMQDSGVRVAPYELRISASRLIVVTGFRYRFEVANQLCVQPVRVKSSASDATPTGAGLAFGTPGANEQWAKADVTFRFRPWKEVTNANWKVPANDTRENELRASVQDDDCIEVFFVQNLTPESKYGGGATWGSGTASSQIISSDGNAVGGIDITHLAHELGHVLNFKHPGTSAPGMTTASTGTLMCPSGWRNDNPRINSQFNADHVSNPLLTFSFKLKSAAPDCNNDADCGACR